MTHNDHPDAVIRPATGADAAAVARIYNHYVLETTVTFEEAPVPEAEMRTRIDDALAAGLPFLVAETNGGIAGFAHASKWKGRCAYRYSVEVTVYLGPAAGGRGLGSALYARLLPSLESLGFHVFLAGIALPNEASVRLHEKFGFVQSGHLREVGFKFGRWIDVGYWQLVVEAGRAR